MRAVLLISSLLMVFPAGCKKKGSKDTDEKTKPGTTTMTVEGPERRVPPAMRGTPERKRPIAPHPRETPKRKVCPLVPVDIVYKACGGQKSPPKEAGTKTHPWCFVYGKKCSLVMQFHDFRNTAFKGKTGPDLYQSIVKFKKSFKVKLTIVKGVGDGAFIEHGIFQLIKGPHWIRLGNPAGNKPTPLKKKYKEIALSIAGKL